MTGRYFIGWSNIWDYKNIPLRGETNVLLRASGYRFMKKWWIITAAIIFILSMDAWNWNQDEPILWFLPFWGWYLMGVVLTTAAIFAAINRYVLREV
jgi:hypothetical protein